MIKFITFAILLLLVSTTLGQYGTSYRGNRKCNSCNKILDDITLTMLLSCRDRVATKYFDLVAVPNVIVDLLRPEMDICLNGPVGAEADPSTYPGTNDYLVEAFVNAYKNPLCRSALNETVLLDFRMGSVDSVKLILKEDLAKNSLKKVAKNCVSIVLKSKC